MCLSILNANSVLKKSCESCNHIVMFVNILFINKLTYIFRTTAKYLLLNFVVVPVYIHLHEIEMITILQIS